MLTKARPAIFVVSFFALLSLFVVPGNHPWLRFDANSDRMNFGPFRFSGLVLDWDPREWTATTYWRGQIHGGEIRFSRNSFRVASWRPYWFGVKVGTHRGWFANGAPRFEYHFRDGLHDGAVKEWHPNGRLFRWIEYENGEEVSQKIWRESGQIYANYVREDHRLRGLQGGKLCLTVKP